MLKNEVRNHNYNLRNSSKPLIEPASRIFSNYGERSFKFFFTNLINKCPIIKNLFIQFDNYFLFNDFKRALNEKIDTILKIFLANYTQFDRNIKTHVY